MPPLVPPTPLPSGPDVLAQIDTAIKEAQGFLPLLAALPFLPPETGRYVGLLFTVGHVVIQEIEQLKANGLAGQDAFALAGDALIALGAAIKGAAPPALLPA